MRKLWLLVILAGLAGAALVARPSVSAAPIGPLAITDTPSPTAPLATETPTPTPTATLPAPTESPTATPADPQVPPPAPGAIVIVKSASVQQASVGDRVDYFLSVSNPHAVSRPDVTVMDILAPELDYLEATSPQGSVAYNSADRTVTFGLGALAPGQTVHLTIATRINSLAQAPAEIRNVARAALSPESNVSIVLVVPASVPATGSGPGLADVYALAVGVAGAIALAAGGLRWQRARRGK